MAEEVVLRRLTCNWPGCGLVFYICNSCYRGHRYCGKTCRKKAQLQQRRNANRRHQQSREGRLDHRDRQRAYRERCRHGRVTDTPSAGSSRSGSIGTTWKETEVSTPLTDKLQDRPRLKRPQDALRPVCMLCGRGGRVEVKRIGPERRQ